MIQYANWSLYIPKRKTLIKLFQFLVVGLPSFLIAIVLNYFLVDQLGWYKWLAYALVLVVQMTINFFACVFFVFERDKNRNILSQFLIFMSGVSVVRVVDWAFYSLLSELLSVHYILIQLFNVIIFSVIKFTFIRHTIEGDVNKL